MKARGKRLTGEEEGGRKIQSVRERRGAPLKRTKK